MRTRGGQGTSGVRNRTPGIVLGLDIDLVHTFGTDDGSQFGLQDLERDLALVLDVLAQINGGHAAFTERGLDAVAALEGCVQALHLGGRSSAALGCVQAGCGVAQLFSHARKMRRRSPECE